MPDLNLNWKALGKVSGPDLAESRISLHHAAQLAACVGQILLSKRPDDSQMALSFLDGVMLGEPLPQDIRVGLRLATCCLEIQNQEGVLLSEFPLSGHPRTEALAWLRARLGEFGVNAESLTLSMPYELPPHPVADGGAFPKNASAALSELAHWFANAALLLAPLATQEDASALRCWPHHFDLAVLLSLEEEASPEQTRSIGVGLSPGDGSYAEPYFYATPWPYPKDVDFPALPFGHWHQSPWVGAVLTATELLQGPIETQRTRAEAFLAAAVEACEALLA